jgi:hypothetical protein
MKIKSESYSLIIAGSWNRHIFTPEWVSRNIFKADQVQIEFPINAIGPLRFEYQKVRLIPAANRLLFIALDNQDETLKKIETMANSISDLLPHTPVTAFGINFGFVDNVANSVELLSIFNIADNERLSSVNAEIKLCMIQRKVIIDGTTILLTLSKDPSNMNFDFNFHFDIKALVELKTILITGKIIECRNLALKILKQAYEMELSTEGESHGQ